MPGPVRLHPTVAPVPHDSVLISNVLPELTLIGLTAPATPVMLLPTDASVKLSVAVSPPNVIEDAGAAPVPFAIAKTATLLAVKADENGPAALAPHFEAVNALPSLAKNWFAACTSLPQKIVSPKTAIAKNFTLALAESVDRFDVGVDFIDLLSTLRIQLFRFVGWSEYLN